MQTMLDLAVDLDLRSVEHALNQARSKRMISDREFAGMAERYHGHHGLRRLTELLDPRFDRGFTRSKAERLLARLIGDAGLESPRRNAHAGGFEVDALWPDQKVVVEFDSYSFHGNRQAFERDRRKWALLQARGYRVLAITWRQLTSEPAWVVARIVELLSAAEKAETSSA